MSQSYLFGFLSGALVVNLVWYIAMVWAEWQGDK